MNKATIYIICIYVCNRNRDREMGVRRVGENGRDREGNVLVMYKDSGHSQPWVQVSVLSPNDCTNLEKLLTSFHY